MHISHNTHDICICLIILIIHVRYLCRFSPVVVSFSHWVRDVENGLLTSKSQIGQINILLSDLQDYCDEIAKLRQNGTPLAPQVLVCYCQIPTFLYGGIAKHPYLFMVLLLNIHIHL